MGDSQHFLALCIEQQLNSLFGHWYSKNSKVFRKICPLNFQSLIIIRLCNDKQVITKRSRTILENSEYRVQSFVLNNLLFKYTGLVNLWYLSTTHRPCFFKNKKGHVLKVNHSFYGTPFVGMWKTLGTRLFWRQHLARTQSTHKQNGGRSCRVN